MWVLTLVIALSSGTFQVKTIPMKDRLDCLRHAEVASNIVSHDFEIVVVSCNQIEEI